MLLLVSALSQEWNEDWNTILLSYQVVHITKLRAKYFLKNLSLEQTYLHLVSKTELQVRYS